MSNLRTSRTRLAAAAATTVLAALALTACGDATGTQDEGAATTNTSATPSAATGAKASEGSSNLTDSAGTKPAAGAKTTTAAAGTSASRPSSARPASGGSSSTPVTCEGSTTKTVAAPLTRPVNHMLLTVTNTGSRTCFLYGSPVVRFGAAQSVPPTIEESQPQAVVTLEPGQSGYASVSLSATDGSAGNGYTAKSLTVYFQGRSLSGSVGKGATPALPAKGVYVDDSLKVTYWQQDMNDAVSW